MIGKSGARQEIENYLPEIGYLIKDARNDVYNAVPNWKTRAIDHINLTLHIIDTNSDSKVEPEEPDYRNGLKFTFIRRGFGTQGANIFLNRGDDMLEIRFFTVDNGKTTSLTYEKDGNRSSLSFKCDGRYIHINND